MSPPLLSLFIEHNLSTSDFFSSYDIQELLFSSLLSRKTILPSVIFSVASPNSSPLHLLQFAVIHLLDGWVNCAPDKVLTTPCTMGINLRPEYVLINSPSSSDADDSSCFICDKNLRHSEVIWFAQVTKVISVLQSRGTFAAQVTQTCSTTQPQNTQ